MLARDQGFRHAQAVPRQGDGGVARGLEVFEDQIRWAAAEGDGAAPFGRILGNPFVDQELAVDPEADAVVGGGVERVGLVGVVGLHLAEPPDGEVVGGGVPRAGERADCAPIKADGGIVINPGRRAGEGVGRGLVRPIEAEQPLGGRAGRVDRRDGPGHTRRAWRRS